jgi:RHS repeat-associated protein
MAATYNGDGDRVLQVTAIPVTATAAAPLVNTGGVTDWLRDNLPDTPGGMFWYGFVSTLAVQVAGSNSALLIDMQPQVRRALTVVEQPVDPGRSLNDHDVDTLHAAGVSPGEVTDWVESAYATLIPDTVSVTVQGWTYELTHYVNDVNTTNTRVLATYGAAGSGFTDYTYGLDQLNTTTGDSTSWYVHDGRGSVGQTLTSDGTVGFAASYDPWGVPTVTTGATASPFYGFNGEDTSPVTGLQYLRARYYQPSMAGFIQSDSYLGYTASPASLNRWAYCVGDPVNYRDSSGLSAVAFLAGDGGTNGAAVWASVHSESLSMTTTTLGRAVYDSGNRVVGHVTADSSSIVPSSFAVSSYVAEVAAAAQAKRKALCDSVDMWAGYGDPSYDPMTEQLPPGFRSPGWNSVEGRQTLAGIGIMLGAVTGLIVFAPVGVAGAAGVGGATAGTAGTTLSVSSVASTAGGAIARALGGAGARISTVMETTLTPAGLTVGGVLGLALNTTSGIARV